MQLNFKCSKCGSPSYKTSMTHTVMDTTFHIEPCDMCIGELTAKNAKLNKKLHKANRHNTVLFVMMIVALFVMVVVAATIRKMHAPNHEAAVLLVSGSPDENLPYTFTPPISPTTAPMAYISLVPGSK